MKKQLDFIGMPINLGCDKAGVELTPNLIRKNYFNNLFQRFNLTDCGNISISQPLQENEKYKSEISKKE